MLTQVYKTAILADRDVTEHGKQGTVLRREGSNPSHTIDRRRAAQAAAAGGSRRARGMACERLVA